MADKYTAHPIKARVITTDKHYVQIYASMYDLWVDHPLISGFPIDTPVPKVRTMAEKSDKDLNFV
jgi:hypothetical protein